jgi:hypothetical protein
MCTSVHNFVWAFLTHVRVQTAKDIKLRVSDGQNVLCVGKQVQSRMCITPEHVSRAERAFASHAAGLLYCTQLSGHYAPKLPRPCSQGARTLKKRTARAGACPGDCDNTRRRGLLVPERRPHPDRRSRPCPHAACPPCALTCAYLAPTARPKLLILNAIVSKSYTVSSTASVCYILAITTGIQTKYTYTHRIIQHTHTHTHTHTHIHTCVDARGNT